jgi:DNA repair exonuclease SbcCD nuclease subunit
MSKVLFITDQHFGVRSDSNHFSHYFERFYNKELLPFIDKHKIERVIDLGDTVDRRKYINFKTLSDARRMWFEPLAKRNIRLDMLIGNHSTYYKNTNRLNSPDLLFKDFTNVIPHSSPVELDIDGFAMAMLPWVCSDNYEESMEFVNNTNATHMCSHLEIAGFEMHLGQISETGFDRSIFSKFEQVYSGHFHHKSSSGNISYLGAPYEMTWADYNDTKGFHVFDTKTREIEFIENPYKMFHKLYYNDTVNDIDDILAQDFDQYTNTYVRLVIQDKSNPFNFERVVDKIEKASPIDLSFVDNTLDLSLDDTDISEDVEDTPSIIASSVDQAVKESQRKDVKKFLLELYNEAISLSRV